MSQLQIKAFITAIENKLDKNAQPYFKLSLQGFPFPLYAFSNNLATDTLATLTKAPDNLINRQVLITYQELPANQGVFRKVKQIEIT